MESAAEALKIFFAVTVFAIALTVLFNMTALTMDTADTIFSSIDKTTYIDYNYDTSDGANRKVTFQEIIPSIYRYAQEGYGVTIIDGGNIVARFDLDTESQIASCLWTNERYSNASQTVKDKSDNIKQQITNYLNRHIVSKVHSNEITNIDTIIKNIYSTGDTTGRDPVYSSWLNANSDQNSNITQRVNCDIYGGMTNFSLTTPGINETRANYIAGSHKAVNNGRGLLAQYANSTFTEYIVQIDQNEYIKDENGENSGLLVYGTIRYTKKRELIYVKN